MSQLKFRNAERKDTSVILTLIKSLAKYERLEDKVVATVESLEVSLFDQKYADVLLLEIESKIIGFALYFFTFSTFEGKPTLYLEDLYIHDEHRGLGYGKETLKKLSDIAKSKGCARFEWSCLDWNQSAIDFYQSLGAKPQKGWTIYRLEKDDFLD
ncbi:MAG: GNAT family N-acetyltransferase [Firmicutes bacterium]|nr:GNAT family N-acetyltransferase [Bacillota bacterium]